MRLLSSVLMLLVMQGCISHKKIDKNEVVGKYYNTKGISSYELYLKTDNTYLFKVQTEPFNLYSSGVWSVSEKVLILNAVVEDEPPITSLVVRRKIDLIEYKDKRILLKGKNLILYQDSLLNITDGQVILKKLN